MVENAQGDGTYGCCLSRPTQHEGGFVPISRLRMLDAQRTLNNEWRLAMSVMLAMLWCGLKCGLNGFPLPMRFVPPRQLHWPRLI